MDYTVIDVCFVDGLIAFISKELEKIRKKYRSVAESDAVKLSSREKRIFASMTRDLMEIISRLESITQRVDELE